MPDLKSRMIISELECRNGHTLELYVYMRFLSTDKQFIIYWKSCNAELERAFSLRLKGVKDKLCVTCTKMHCKNILKVEMRFLKVLGISFSSML